MDTEAGALFELKMGENKEATINDVKESFALNIGKYEHIEYTPESWQKLFPDNTVQTPLGEIKLGESQYKKLDPTIPDPKNPSRQKQDRRHHLSFIHQTLTSPAFGIQKSDGSKIFFKEFKVDGKSNKQYASIIVSKGDMDINISNYSMGYGQILKEAKKGDVIYTAPRVTADGSALLVSHPTPEFAGDGILHQRQPESQEAVVNGLYMQMGMWHIIETFKSADFATVMHEYGHYFRRTLSEMERMIAEKAFGVERGFIG